MFHINICVLPYNVFEARQSEASQTVFEGAIHGDRDGGRWVTAARLVRGGLASAKPEALSMSANRKYLKDALPRFYGDLEDTLKCDWPEMLPQIAHLYITRRCQCGDEDCRSFDCESDDPRYVPIGGRRPLSYAIARVDGWYQVSPEGVLSGFEILSDYWDGSLERGLVAAGFPIERR